jgi:hypothetical protein
MAINLKDHNINETIPKNLFSDSGNSTTSSCINNKNIKTNSQDIHDDKLKTTPNIKFEKKIVQQTIMVNLLKK